jgi:hypothetical protein
LIKVDVFKMSVGILLIGYCTFMLGAAGHLHIRRAGAAAEMLIGFLGGVLGGIAGLSGPPPIVWGTLRAWPKARRRRTLQAFNTAILAAMLLASLLGGLIGMRLLVASAIALPATLLGNWLGERLYRRLDERRFDRVVLGTGVLVRLHPSCIEPLRAQAPPCHISGPLLGHNRARARLRKTNAANARLLGPTRCTPAGGRPLGRARICPGAHRAGLGGDRGGKARAGD